MNQPVLGTDPAFQLASALQAIEDAEKDWAVSRADHKERMERLYQEAGKLRYEILTGQKQLSLEAEEKPLEVLGGTSLTEIVERTAAAINTGLLDTPDCKVTAIINPGDDARV